MKVESKFATVLVSIFALIVLVFFEGFGALFLLLMGKIDYIALLITVGLVLYLLFVFNLLHLFQTKKRKVIFGSIAGGDHISQRHYAYKRCVYSLDTYSRCRGGYK